MDKGNVQKEVSKKFKVIGVSRVNIPSPYHPIIPYNVLMLEDEFGNRMPKKTMKDFRIGDSYEFQSGEVSVVKQKYDIYEAVKLSLELIPDFVVNGDSKILIKPSVISAMYAYLAATTNPKVLTATIQILLEKGVLPENITVGEQTPFLPLEVSSKKPGISSVCKKFNVKLVDLGKAGFEEKEGYELSKELLDKTLIINMPSMKLDTRFGISGALENMTRCLSLKSQKKLYNEDIRKSMDTLNKLIPTQLVIADAILAMQGDGPLMGEPSYLNMIIAGHDPVAVDETFCRITMMDTPDYVKNTSGNHSPTVGGDELDACRYPVRRYIPGLTPNHDIRIIGDSPCPVCYFSAIGALSKLATTRGKPTYLAIGSHLDKEQIKNLDRVVALGDQAIQALEDMGIEPSAKLAGCPPDMADQVIFIKKIFTSNLDKPKVTVIDKLKSAIVKAAMKVGK